MEKITINVDAELATHYFKQYYKAFNSPEIKQLPLKEFLTAFVEDRLSEEIHFLENEFQLDEPTPD